MARHHEQYTLFRGKTPHLDREGDLGQVTEGWRVGARPRVVEPSLGLASAGMLTTERTENTEQQAAFGPRHPALDYVDVAGRWTMRAAALLAVVIAASLTQSAQAIIMSDNVDVEEHGRRVSPWVSAAEAQMSGLTLRLEFWESDYRDYSFKLLVTNTGNSARILERPTQELFDFSVLRDGEVVWHLNRNTFFTQTPHTLTIEPGETQDYTATWDGKDDRGFPLKTWLGIDLEAQLKMTGQPLTLRIGNVHPAAASTALSAYADVRRDHWAYDALDTMQELGVLEGYPDRWFSGERTLTRYEMAQVVARLLDVMSRGGYDESVEALAQALEAEFADQLAQLARQLYWLYD